MSTAPTGNTLICGVNWLGDSCMSMPAIQAWKARHPHHTLTLLIKPGLQSLWQCHPAIDQILTLAPGNRGPFQTGRDLRKQPFETAYIFPNSWRAALPPWIGKIPRRIGFAGHTRRWLLTTVIPDSPATEHQQWEYARILDLPRSDSLPMPELVLPDPPEAMAQQKGPCIGILPGAARGPAKRWPSGHFIEAARHLRQQQDFHFCVMGTPAEAPVCEEIASALQPHAQCLAGSTTLPTLAAALRSCAGVLTNDSGGMHLAAAVGSPVVAMFGLTDPAKTGPIGPYTSCLQPAGIQGARKISRHSEEAQRILASIAPKEAASALLECMQNKNAKPSGLHEHSHPTS